jgi:hypothetical protein
MPVVLDEHDGFAAMDDFSLLRFLGADTDQEMPVDTAGNPDLGEDLVQEALGLLARPASCESWTGKDWMDDDSMDKDGEEIEVVLAVDPVRKRLSDHLAKTAMQLLAADGPERLGAIALIDERDAAAFMSDVMLGEADAVDAIQSRRTLSVE